MTSQARINIARRNYQQPQICRWYHPNGRKQRGTKEPFDEGEKGEWKSWFKTQYSKNEDHGIRSHHFMANRREKSGNCQISFSGSKITVDGDYSHKIKRYLLLGRKAKKNLDSVLKSRDITLLTKVCIVKAMVFPVVMYGWELDHKEGWAPKNWCFRTVVLEKTLESPLDSKEIKPVNPKGYQPWIFTGKTDAEALSPILWIPDAKRQLTGEKPNAGKDWGQEEKGATEDEIVGYHQWLSGHEFEQTLRDNGGQGSLACCCSWCRKELDTTEQLNNKDMVST